MWLAVEANENPVLLTVPPVGATIMPLVTSTIYGMTMAPEEKAAAPVRVIVVVVPEAAISPATMCVVDPSDAPENE